MNEQGYIFGFRKSAIIEIAVFFIAMLVVDNLLFSGDRFITVNPHPFWAIILLLAVQYGTSHALLAVFVSCVALYLGNIPEQQLGEVTYNYILGLLKNPVLWVVAAVSLGEIRQRHVRERNRLLEELFSSQEREDTVATAYSRLKELKENLELRVAGQLRSSIETYKAAKAIEKSHPVDVLNGIEELIRAVMNPQKFSVYILEQDGLNASITYGWDQSDSYLRNFGNKSALFNEVIGRQHFLCVVNDTHEAALANQGVLAGPIINTETGEVMGMLKIETLGFLDLNLSSIETFNAICEWVGMALANARNYQTAKSESLVNPEHNLLSYNYFKRYTDHITSLSKRVGFDVSMVAVKLANSNNIADEKRRALATILSDSVQASLRTVDLAFDHQSSGDEFAVVLPATNAAGAKIVMDKIIHELQPRIKKIEKNAQFTYTVHALSEKVANNR